MSAADAIPEAVRRLAEHPHRELPLPPSAEWIEQDGVVMVVTPQPTPQIVHPVDLEVAGLGAAVDAMRAIGRARGKTVLGWWITPDHDAFVPQLEGLGMVNEDTGGYEAVESAMVLVIPPRGAAGAGVEVKQIETFEEFAGAAHVAMEAFELPPDTRAQSVAGLAQRYAEYRDPANAETEFVALVDGRIVGSAAAIPAAAGVSLFGGAVLPEARGRGVYRALLHARWEFAVQRGTPALTVQAGRMSKPILERLGFVELVAARVFFDRL